MRIISKYKDYYDYLTGVYGEDPKIILDRRTTEYFRFNSMTATPEKIILIIAGYLVEGYLFNGKIYYGEELRQFAYKNNYYQKYIKHNQIIIDGDRWKTWEDKTYTLEPTPGYEEWNEKHGCEILYFSYNIKQITRPIKYPELNQFNLGSFIPAEQIYNWLSTYLAKKVDELQNQSIVTTDIQKLENKGFDRKTSFRPNIKK